MTKAGVRFAVLGADERDCGDLARRLGDEATFQRLARDNIATLAAAASPASSPPTRTPSMC